MITETRQTHRHSAYYNINNNNINNNNDHHTNICITPHANSHQVDTLQINTTVTTLCLKNIPSV